MKTLENQMKIYLSFLKLFGQFPFSIQENLAPSALLRIYGVVLSSILGVLAGLVVVQELPTMALKEALLRAGFFMTGLALLLATTIIPIFKSALYCTVFQRFNKVERYFHHLGISIEEKKNSYPALIILFKQMFIFGVVFVTEYIFPYWVTNMPFYNTLFYWFALITMTVISMNCGTYGHLLISRYDAINNELTNIEKRIVVDKILVIDKIFNNNFINRKQPAVICPTDDYSSTKVLKNQEKTVDYSEKVKLLQKCHYELYGICSSMGGMFTFPIVLTIFFTGCELLFSSFMGFGKILRNETVNVVEMAAWVKYIIFDLIRVISILKAFTSIEKSGNTTSFQIHGLILKAEDSRIQKELIKFSQQLLHQKINFSTCGFFSLDMSLLVSMAGAITTYLVILLQFSTDKCA